ncbi:MAG: TIM barrel protein [Candidatus Ratteibacteria bacterium]|nr:TIM barrel protein [Candidatus Ratteibacteria bacterium]
MITYGIMQGRLTEPGGRGIQFFPFENWKDEFEIARQIGMDEIEFIFDYENYKKNPLWSKEGIEEIKTLMMETGIRVNSICFDYFMRKPFFKANGKAERKLLYQENKIFLEKIMKVSADLGIKLIEIPLVDSSAIKTGEEKELFREFLCTIFKQQADNSIYIGLETDFSPLELKKYIESFNNLFIKANYDTGNSSALGYNVYQEIIILKELIFNIHIKDRVLNGGTVQLGSGNADFVSFFKALKEINYSGSLILQAARGEDGYERETVAGQLNFVKEYVKNFNI